jgi:hypothetical protein
MPDLISDDSLPGLAHTFLALGDLPEARTSLLLRIADFVETSGSRARIRQHHPEGDFHPWQSFAYLTLLDPAAGDWTLTDGTTIREVARGSTDLAVEQAEELGHPLLAASWLFGDADVPPLRFGGTDLNVEEILRHALYAQWFGHFDVCRKFHLTEGIVSITARQTGLGPYRHLAAAALSGQYRVLEATAALTYGLAHRLGDPQLAQLRTSLGLSDLFQDHLFYVGHLLELSNLAAAVGADTPSPLVLEPMINVVNAWLIEHLARGESLRSNVVQVSHYLRGLSHYLARRAPAWTVADVMAAPAAPFPFAAETAALELPRPLFRSSLDAINRTAPEITLRGSLSHFRRYRPAHWPRPLHYELLDYGDWLGVEVHIESDDCLWARPVLLDLARRMVVPSGADRIEFDPQWWLGRGRLRILFQDESDPARVARGFAELIQASEPALTDAMPAPMTSGPRTP